MKKSLLLILMLLGLRCIAQQDPLYSLYMTNMQAINPAYAGIHNSLIATVNYRSQWANLPHHPVTTTASVHSNLFGDYVGGGLLIVQDQIGVVKNTETYLMSSYQINGGGYKLSFGLQLGIVNQRFDYSMLNLDPSATDPELMDQSGNTKFNIGSGIVFMSDALFLSVSVPRLAQPELSSNTEGASFTNDPTIYAVGSTIFPLDVDTELQPTVLLRYGGGLTSFDVGLNWVYERFFNVGVFTRELSTFGASLGIKVMNKLTCRYSFEIYTKGSTDNKNYSNEISIGLNVPVFSRHEVSDSVF